jgi:hypothetical protein
MTAGVVPSLDEVLADQIMGLLWHADHLPPARARARIRTLQALVTRTSDAKPVLADIGGRFRGPRSKDAA